jgi:hypothetical protein
MFDLRFPLVSVGSAFPERLLGAASRDRGGIKHCLDNKFRVGLRQELSLGFSAH